MQTKINLRWDRKYVSQKAQTYQCAWPIGVLKVTECGCSTECIAAVMRCKPGEAGEKTLNVLLSLKEFSKKFKTMNAFK